MPTHQVVTATPQPGQLHPWLGVCNNDPNTGEVRQQEGQHPSQDPCSNAYHVRAYSVALEGCSGPVGF